VISVSEPVQRIQSAGADHRGWQKINSFNFGNIGVVIQDEFLPKPKTPCNHRGSALESSENSISLPSPLDSFVFVFGIVIVVIPVVGIGRMKAIE
jgi:hypothetical protein